MIEVLTFSQWLLKQQYRRDRVGQLARDILHDVREGTLAEAPRSVVAVARWRLRKCPLSPYAIVAVEQADREYEHYLTELTATNEGAVK